MYRFRSNIRFPSSEIDVDRDSVPYKKNTEDVMIEEFIPKVRLMLNADVILNMID